MSRYGCRIKELFLLLYTSLANFIAFCFTGAQDNLIISVQGGRYDVDIIERSRTAVYWDETTSYVRRCSWFYKEDGESRFLPYDESFADRLEVRFIRMFSSISQKYLMDN